MSEEFTAAPRHGLRLWPEGGGRTPQWEQTLTEVTPNCAPHRKGELCKASPTH